MDIIKDNEENFEFYFNKYFTKSDANLKENFSIDEELVCLSTNMNSISFKSNKISNEINNEEILNKKNEINLDEKISKESHIKSQIKLSNKKGRKKSTITNQKNIHDKTEKGNIRSKIKNKFHKFIIEFFNEKIKKINNGRQKVKFRTIDYKITNIRNKKANKDLLNIKLKDFFQYNISIKYTDISKQQNQKTLNKMNSDLSEYFEMTYEYFYTNYFLKKIHSEFSKKITFFDDFIKQEKEKEINKINELYSNDTIKNYYFEKNNNYINNIIETANSYISFYKKEKKSFLKNKRELNN
jgi:hypothetical protein